MTMQSSTKKALGFALGFFFCFSAARSLFAQQEPRIGYAYPAGAGRGEKLAIVIGGMNLRGVKDADFSGDGIKLVRASFSRPLNNLNNDLKNEIRPLLEAIDEGKDPLKAIVKSSEEILTKLKKQYEAEKRQSTENKNQGAPGETKSSNPENQFENMLKIVPGERLIYVDKTPEEVIKMVKALTPLEYQILCKEVFSKQNPLQASPAIEQMAVLEIEVAKNALLGQRELRLISQNGVSNPLVFEISELPEQTLTFYSRGESPATEIKTFPSILNGAIMPGETDQWKFNARKGESFLFTVSARKLNPFLGDAVPGWFQAFISIHDKSGKCLAFSDDNYFDPDPVLSFCAPSDSEYQLQIRDSIYRGREDFVYRIKAEKRVPEQLDRVPKKPDCALPVLEEDEDNGKISNAQKIAKGTLVEGKIGSAGDADCFRVDLKKGEKLALEVFARRLDSPLDSLIQVFDADEKMIAWNDDWSWLKVGMNTHQSDSYCLLESPSDGRFFIKISDAQGKGGGDYFYALRIGEALPSFKIFAYPSVINASSGISTPFSVAVMRLDGFDSEIEVSISQGPKDCIVEGGKIAPGTKSQRMTIFVPEKVKNGFHEIRMIAKGKTKDGKEISVELQPCDEIMQAFIYMHLLPSDSFRLFIKRKSWTPFKRVPELISLKPGEEKEIAIPCPGYKPKDGNIYRLELDSPPTGIEMRDGELRGDIFAFKLCVSKEAKPWTGNLIFQVVSENKGKKQKWGAGYYSALPCEINASK